MRAAVSLAVAAVALTACGGNTNDFIPPGSYAGSTANDRAFTLDVSDKVRINRHEARFVRRGVVELRDRGTLTRLTCKVLDDKGEELRCTLRVAPADDSAPTTEVLDLMLL